MCVCVSVCKKIVLKSKINFYWSIFFKSQKRQSLSPVSLESKKSLVQCSQDFWWRKSENWKDKHEFIQEKRRIRDLEISLFLHWPCDIRAPFVFCYCCLFSLEIKHTNCPGYRNRAVANVPSDLTLFYWFPPTLALEGDSLNVSSGNKPSREAVSGYFNCPGDSRFYAAFIIQVTHSICHTNKIISNISKSFTEYQIANCAVERPWGKSLYSDSAALFPHPRRTGFLFVCAHTCVCAFASWVQVHEVARRGRQIPWSCSCRHLAASQNECWEPNSGPLE